MRTIIYGNHTIKVKATSLTGREDIHYDDQLVSSKHSMFGTTHLFSVKEDGENVQYEVEIGVRWHGMSNWAIVRRNGIIIYSDK